jgi:hypothetical protein
MSSQQPDTVAYGGEAYELIGLRGDGPFDPEAYGIQTVPPHTGCWRGFIAGYEVRARRLYLQSLSIWAAGPLPALFGVEATGSDEDDGVVRHLFDPSLGGRVEGEYTFEDAPIAFTGGLLVGREFVGQGHSTLGGDPPWLYATVHALTFEDGWLVDAIDRSAEMAAARVHAGRDGDELDTIRSVGATHPVVLDRATRGRRPSPPPADKGRRKKP